MQTLKQLFREKVSRTVATECSDEVLFQSAEMVTYLNGMVHRLTNRRHSLKLLPPGNPVTAYTDGKTITVNPFHNLISSLPLQSQRALATTGFVCHECAHIRYLDFKADGQIRDRIKNGELGPFPANLSATEEQYLRELQQMADETPLTFGLMLYLYSELSNIIEDVHDEGCLVRDFKGIVPASLKILQDSMQSKIMPFEKAAQDAEDGERNDLSLFFSSALQVARFGEIVAINNEKAAKDPIYQAALQMLPIAKKASQIDSIMDRWPYINHCILQVWPFVRDSLMDAAMMNDMLDDLMKNMPQQSQNKSGQQPESGSQSDQPGESGDGSSNGSQTGEPGNAGNPKKADGNSTQTGNNNAPSGNGPAALRNELKLGQSDQPSNGGSRQEGDVGQNSEAGNQNAAGNTDDGEADNSEANSENKDVSDNSDTAAKGTNDSEQKDEAESANDGAASQGDDQNPKDDGLQNAAGNKDQGDDPTDDTEDGERTGGGQDPADAQNAVPDGNANDEHEEDEADNGAKNEGGESGSSDSSEDGQEGNAGQTGKPDFSKLTSQDIQDLISKLKDAAKNAGIDSPNDDQGSANDDEGDQGSHQMQSDYSESIISHGRMNPPDNNGAESDDEVSAEAVFSKMSAQIAKQIAESNMEQAVEDALNNEYTNDLHLASQTSPHRGRPIFVRRTHDPLPSDIKKYESVLSVVKPYSVQAQRRIVPILEELKSGSVERHRPFGRTVESKDGYRPDGKFFSKIKLPQDLPDMAIAILVDQSGSMNGTRIEQAQKAAVLLDDFATSIGIPTLVVGHNTSGATANRLEGTSLYLHAMFERVSKKDKARLVMMKASGSNRDGMALNAVTEILAKRPEEYKILIIISDGMPNSQEYGGALAEQDIRNIVAAAKRKGVQTFAAAIGSSKENIRRIYGEGFLDITDLSTLPRSLLKIISKRII